MVRCALPETWLKTSVRAARVLALVALIARMTATPRMTPEVVSSVRKGLARNEPSASAMRRCRLANLGLRSKRGSSLVLGCFHGVDHHSQALDHVLLRVERDIVQNLAVSQKHHAVRIGSGARVMRHDDDRLLQLIP